MPDKFLKLVEENTPGHKQESLADQFMRFAEKVSALEEGRPVNVDELRLELNELDAKLEALSAPVEDQEMATTDTKKMTDMANTAAKIMAIKSPSLKDQVLNPASRKIQMAKRTLADKIHKAAKKFEI